MLDALLADLERDGAREVEIIEQARWKYAPQLEPAALREGGLANMERQQGRKQLWVTGATTSHEAVDNIIDYNERLVERMAAEFAGSDPGDPRLLDDIADRYRLRFGDK